MNYIPDIELGGEKYLLQDTTALDAFKLIPPTQVGKFVSFENDPVNINSYSTNANYTCYVVPCAEGDKFTVSATGGSNAKAYGFVDAQGNQIEGSIAPNGYTAKGLVLTAPENAAYLIINDKDNLTSYYGEYKLFMQGKGIISAVDAANGVTLDQLTNGIWQISADFHTGDRTGDTDTKTPPEFVYRGIAYHLISSRFGANSIIQLAISANHNKAFIRRILSGEWTEWNSFSGMGINYVTSDIQSFDEMVLPGVYNVYTSDMERLENAPSPKTVCICLVTNTGLTDDASNLICQYVFYIDGGTAYTRRRVISTGNWTSWTPLGVTYASLADYTSIDDVKKTGFYYIDSNRRTELGAPCKYASAMLVFSPGNNTTISTQAIFDSRDGRIYMRKLIQDNYGIYSWTEWKTLMTDPVTSLTWKYDFDSEVVQDTWDAEWETQFPARDPNSDSLVHGRLQMKVNNTGLKLKVVSYNIAAYHMAGSDNSDVFLYSEPEKLLNFRRWFCQMDPDVMLTQEDAPYIDAETNGIRSASKYIYYDRLPCKEGNNNVYIRSKFPCIVARTTCMTTTMIGVKKKVNGQWVDNTDVKGRYMTWGMYKTPDEQYRILMISMHARNTYNYFFDEGSPATEPGPIYGPVRDRMTELQIMYDMIFCLRHPEIYSGIATGVDQPWDYVIIGGDFNLSNINGQSIEDGNPVYYSRTLQDYVNFLTLRDYYHFDSANGGYLNWFVTHKQNGGASLDNILVSDNIILQTIDARYELFSSLYSDHIPVETTMTLLDPTKNLDSDIARLNPELPNIKLLNFPSTTYEGKTISNPDHVTALRSWFTTLWNGTIQRPCE